MKKYYYRNILTGDCIMTEYVVVEKDYQEVTEEEYYNYREKIKKSIINEDDYL